MSEAAKQTKPVLCVDCRFYQAAANESDDRCTHDQAQHSAVREVRFYRCGPMRDGICGREACLFAARESEAA